MGKKTAIRKKARARAAAGKARKLVEREPAYQGWATSDADEVERRRWRGRAEIAHMEALQPDAGAFGAFAVRSASGGAYEVEIRSLSAPENSCGCHDFTTNGLGTCKHIEGVLHKLRRRGSKTLNGAAGAAGAARVAAGSTRAEIYAAGYKAGEIQILWPAGAKATALGRKIERRVEALRAGEGDAAATRTGSGSTPALRAGKGDALAALRRLEAGNPESLRVSRYLDSWLEDGACAARRAGDREKFLAEVKAGRSTLDVVKHPLLPYQVEGMLHLVFGERALLADDMGLGKTVQAVAACEMLRRLQGIERVLVVSPASLKAEWLEQIARFSDLPAGIVSGPRAERLARYRDPAFFTLANYEQIIPDGPEINRILKPDVVILDEAQRIKNWQTKTARAVKGLRSPYAFVLTGTPLENRIDEIYSIVQFLDPRLLGPLFRFNRDYYVLDERGRPQDYKNLDDLGRRLQSVMLRRRKSDVEEQLPGRTLTNYFVTMTGEQRLRYEDYKKPVQRLLQLAARRPLTKQEHDRLQLLLACMRMTCDTPYILDADNRDCPKLEELERILGDLLAEDSGRKIIIFSEWVRMLELVRELALEMGLEFAWHTGSVPQDRRRAEINRFKKDPACRLFLSSEAGGVGLNLQVADTVINMDLPWNPAKLEQRIARAWRKYQTRPVGVVNLIAEDSIEHRMVYLLEQKQGLADGVLDGLGDVKAIRMPTGRAAFLARMEAVMGEVIPEVAMSAAGDPALALRDELLDRHGERLLSLVSRGANGSQILVAVLDAPAVEMEEERRRLQEGAKMTVEVLDRDTFATISRLEAAGVLRFTGEAAREIHRSPRLDDGKNASLEQARRLTGEADRKLRMASLLAGGGFEPEALAPAGAALKAALRSLALVSGDGDPGDGGDVGELAEGLAGKGVIPLDLKRGIEAAKANAAGLQPPISLVRDLMEHARDVLEAATMGPAARNHQGSGRKARLDFDQRIAV